MTILFYKDNEIIPHAGGISRINCNLRDALVKRGHSCFFLSSTQNKSVAPDDCQHWLPDLYQVDSKENVLWLYDFIIENKVDVIINSVFDRASVQMLDEARKKTPCKLITWIHNNIVEYGSLIGYRHELSLRKKHLGFVFQLMTFRCVVNSLRLLSKRKHTSTAQMCYQCSDRVIVVCDGNIKEFLYLLGHTDAQNKVMSISNFVPTLNEEVVMVEKAYNVVWCGAVDFELKKTNWMLEIWRNIQALHPQWTLTIMGDSKHLDEMKRYASDLDVKRVIFTGRVNPSTYYRKASIICSTSISESFGLTMVEGMQSHAVPVAFASSPAIRDVVGYNGRLIKPYDKKKFSDELSKLMGNTSHREFLAEKCRNASKQYEEEQILKLWDKLLQIVCKNRETL